MLSLKKLLGIILAIIIVVFSMMLSTSYAWYAFENASTAFEGKTNNDEILVGYGTNEFISTSTAVPILEEDIDKYSEKNSFFVNVKENAIDTELAVAVSLVDIVIDDALKVASFRFDLYYQGELIKTITGEDFENNLEDKKELDVVLLDNTIDNNFELRVYILDDGTDQSGMMSKTFSAKVSVDIISRIQSNVLLEGINSNNSFTINKGERYINASGDISKVNLSLLSDNALTMCISVDTSVCSDYIDFSNSYLLDWTNVEDGEKIVYVYYKDVDGKIVAAMRDSVILDTVSPINNSVLISEGSSLNRTLTLYSEGASSMCISNTLIDSNECINWVDYNPLYEWTLEVLGENTYGEVFVYFRDDALNVAEVVSARVDLTDYIKQSINNNEVINTSDNADNN